MSYEWNLADASGTTLHAALKHLDTEDDACIDQGLDQEACLDVGCCRWDENGSPEQCWKGQPGGPNDCDDELDDYRVGADKCPVVKYGVKLKSFTPSEAGQTATIDTDKIQGGTGSSPSIFDIDSWPDNMPVGYDGQYLTFKPRF